MIPPDHPFSPCPSAPPATSTFRYLLPRWYKVTQSQLCAALEVLDLRSTPSTLKEYLAFAKSVHIQIHRVFSRNCELVKTVATSCWVIYLCYIRFCIGLHDGATSLKWQSIYLHPTALIISYIITITHNYHFTYNLGPSLPCSTIIRRVHFLRVWQRVEHLVLSRTVELQTTTAYNTMSSHLFFTPIPQIPQDIFSYP